MTGTERGIEDARSCVVSGAFDGLHEIRGLDHLSTGTGCSRFQYRSGVGCLDVWFVQRVLSVERFRGKPQLIRYVPGHWEHHLMDAAKVAA